MSRWIVEVVWVFVVKGKGGLLKTQGACLLRACEALSGACAG
ncbi:hypothetical protein [Bartonella sp. AP9QHHD]